ncbi:MAG: hypothetical protein H6716_27190 [Polyangiaceae bacterium]|nr:hypothetical protein [Polyangiaceae bacterium]
MTIAFSPSVWTNVLEALSLSRQRWVQSVAVDLSDAHVDSESTLYHALDVTLRGMRFGGIVRALIELMLGDAPSLDVRVVWQNTLALVDSRDWGSDPVPEIALIRAGIQWAQVEAPSAVEFDAVWLIASIESPISFVPSSSRSGFSSWGLFGNPTSRKELLAELWRLDVTWQDVSQSTDDVSVLRDQMALVHSSAGGLSARQWVRLTEFTVSRLTNDAASLRLAVTQACEIATSGEESRDAEWGRRIAEQLRGTQGSEVRTTMLRDALRALHPALFAELSSLSSSIALGTSTIQATAPEPRKGDDTTRALETSQQLVKDSKPEKAISRYRALVDAHPPVEGPLVKLRNLFTKSDERSKAIATHVRLARRYADQGAFENAVAVYNQILELDASDIDTRFKLALMYEHLELVEDALFTYEMVATSYALAGQFEQATDPVGRMASLDPENVAVRIKYAEALSKVNRIEDAANEFAASAELLRSWGRMDDYIKVAERLLFHRRDVALAREVAELYLERNDAKRALSKLQVCFQANPKDVTTLELLARAFHMLGQSPKAISVYREIARIYDETKRPEERSRNLRKILELDPNDAEAQTALGIAPAQPSRSDVSSLLDEPPETVMSGGSLKALQPTPFAEHSSTIIAHATAPILPSAPGPPEGDDAHRDATVHRAGELQTPYAPEDDEMHAVTDEDQASPRNNKDAPPTLRGAAPITLLTRDRTQKRKASLALDLESYMSAVRQSVVSDSMHNELDAHSARVQAALQLTQVAEQLLQRRVSDFRTDHRAMAMQWAPIVGSFCGSSVREKLFGDSARKQRVFHAKRFAQAMEGADMSLGVMSGWFRPAWRFEPEFIAQAMQDVVGIPSGAEEMVFRLGAVRNVLAHRHEYERNALRSLGPAEGWVCRTTIAERKVVDVPLHCFDEMDSLVVQMIERSV